MLKSFAAVLLATSTFATTSARGGGPAETMPGTNFTDMPSYPAKPVEPLRRIKHTREHIRNHIVVVCGTASECVCIRSAGARCMLWGAWP